MKSNESEKKGKGAREQMCGENQKEGRTGASPEHFAFMIVGHYNSLRVNEQTFTAVARNALI